MKWLSIFFRLLKNAVLFGDLPKVIDWNDIVTLSAVMPPLRFADISFKKCEKGYLFEKILCKSIPFYKWSVALLNGALYINY